MITRKFFIVFLLITSLILGTVQAGLSQDASEKENRFKPRLGGPDTVNNQLETDRAEKDVLYESKLFEPYFEWQAGLREKYGFSFGLDYSGVYLKASDSLPEKDDYASSGMVRFFGSWELLGRGSDTTGALIYKIENRHRYVDTPANGLSLGNVGNIGVLEPPFNDQGGRLTNLFWRQSWEKGAVVAVAGFLDSTDFVDIFALGSPWMHFMNFSFSTGVATISLPEDAAIGAGIGGWVTDQIYITGGLTDTNSDPSAPFEGFETFVNEHEYFKFAEVGWTTSQERAYLDNLHLTVWQADAREVAGVTDGWGAVVSFTQYVNDKWMPFIRAGHANDGGSLLQKSVSVGFGYQPNPVGGTAGNLLGVGVNWGQPNEAVFGPDLNDQYAVETFYRLQVTKELAITPDVQLLINPALNPEEDQVWVFGLRARLAL